MGGMKLSELIKHVQTREVCGGISTAYGYLKDLEGCFSPDGVCPKKLLGKSSRFEWNQVLKRSQRQLTYHHKEMVAYAPFEPSQEDMFDGVPASACAAFDCIVTTRRRDRDGDVLETAGARLDPYAPLLWQHMPFEPIGRLVRELDRTSNMMRARLAIIDNELGRDANALLDFGALRISHGFLPSKFEPLDKDDPWGGFRIKQFEIMEISLVSVPSNVDATITAYSRRKLHHPMVKEWAKRKYDSRPRHGVGFDLAQKDSCGCGGTCDACRPLAESTSVLSVEALERLCPSCAAKARKQGFTGIKLSAIVKQMPSHLLDGLCERLSEEAHPWQACMEMDFGDEFEPEDRDAFCAFLKRECGLDDEEEGKAPSLSCRKGGFTKDIDIATADFPVYLERDKVASEFIGVPIRDLVERAVLVPWHRWGSFSLGLKDVLGDTVVAVRNLTDGAEERPPRYDKVQLNSTKAMDFLVLGCEFRNVPALGKMMIYYDRYDGVRVFARADKSAAVDAAIDRAWMLTKTVYHFLKGEAFTLTGKFLERGGETLDDVFLEPENAVVLKRVLARFNAKGPEFPGRGMLLCGPPGTGKTMSARILKDQCQGTFIWCSSRDFWHTGGFGGIAMAFEEARDCAPAMVCFEDVDNWLDSYSIDLLKTEMDGLVRQRGVLTLMTTNFPERLPDALLDRPGRFHDVLQFGLPSASVRLDMVKRWLPRLSDDAAAHVAAATDGMSGAHVRELASFAEAIEEQDEKPIDEAVSDALKKVQEQRELISERLTSGSHYRPSARAAASVTRAVRVAAKDIDMKRKTKSCKPCEPVELKAAEKPDDADMPEGKCPECGGKMVDGVCEECGYSEPEPETSKKPIHPHDESIMDTCPECATPMNGADTCPACGAARRDQPGFKDGEGEGKGKLDAPHYATASSSLKSCQTCVHFEPDSMTCQRFGFVTEKAGVCDDWQAAEVTSDDRETAKSRTGAGSKAGRILSAKNEKTIREARDDVQELSTYAGLPRSAVALANAAVQKLDGVLASVAQAPTMEASAPEDRPVKAVAAEFMVHHVWRADDATLEDLESAIRAERGRREGEEISHALEALI